MAEPARVRVDVLGSPIDVLSWTDALDRIAHWACRKESRYVCICNAHSVVTASQEADFSGVIAAADMATPDGAPVAWMIRRQGHPLQERINGPDLMLRLSERAAAEQIPVFLLGSTQETLDKLQAALLKRWPQLNVAGAFSPPFRSATDSEDHALVNMINASAAGILLVSLGCPKQERWMAAHRGRINAVMLGVGAAFDFHAGVVRRAPPWMQRHSLEWLHRLASEPRRLWRRYLITNSLFLFKALRQVNSTRK